VIILSAAAISLCKNARRIRSRLRSMSDHSECSYRIRSLASSRLLRRQGSRAINPRLVGGGALGLIYLYPYPFLLIAPVALLRFAPAAEILPRLPSTSLERQIPLGRSVAVALQAAAVRPSAVRPSACSISTKRLCFFPGWANGRQKAAKTQQKGLPSTQPTAQLPHGASDRAIRCPLTCAAVLSARLFTSFLAARSNFAHRAL
jgi:hypothetical protein